MGPKFYHLFERQRVRGRQSQSEGSHAWFSPQVLQQLCQGWAGSSSVSPMWVAETQALVPSLWPTRVSIRRKLTPEPGTEPHSAVWEVDVLTTRLHSHPCPESLGAQGWGYSLGSAPLGVWVSFPALLRASSNQDWF